LISPFSGLREGAKRVTENIRGAASIIEARALGNGRVALVQVAAPQGIGAMIFDVQHVVGIIVRRKRNCPDGYNRDLVVTLRVGALLQKDSYRYLMPDQQFTFDPGHEILVAIETIIDTN
jgi:hypothetical protein